ncbi:hypothetical protein GCWU000341_02720 [Oribacterium sp. oral taxon 078 str. F0262]|nr:hypothetical protein GCWU000341_02720 [Oribacterium sp. oral taxon 078 str. F0262]
MRRQAKERKDGGRAVFRGPRPFSLSHPHFDSLRLRSLRRRAPAPSFIRRVNQEISM